MINLNIATSSQTKGETMLDTVDNLAAMHADMFIVRHSQSGAPHLIAQQRGAAHSRHQRRRRPPRAPDARPARHVHHSPLQERFHNLTVAIVGDVLHSRVARSQIHALTTLGVPEVRVIGPKTLLPTRRRAHGRPGLSRHGSGSARLRRRHHAAPAERTHEGRAAASPQEFFKFYGLTPEKLALAKPDAIVMHPGPMNRGVEIDSEVADGPQSVILPQVTFGIAVRMAVMSIVGRNGKRMKIHIRNGRVIDPMNARDEVADLYVAAGKIVAIGHAPAGFHANRTIDATGLVVCPGLVDLSVRLREPGFEYSATLESEMLAAAAGGITSLACPPDTDPPLDEPGLVEMLKFRARNLPGPRVYPIGALTQKLDGQMLTEMAELTEAGCVAFTQADAPPADTQVLLRAMQYAATFGFSLWLRPQDLSLARDGVAHDGEVASRLGLAGIPALAETVALATILLLARETGARVHLARLSTREGIAMVRAAKAQGLAVTCDVASTHVHLSENDLVSFDSHLHLVPPLQEPARPRCHPRSAARRHHRRPVFRPHAGRRGRQAGALRRVGPGRHRRRTAAAADAEVGARDGRAADAGNRPDFVEARANPGRTRRQPVGWQLCRHLHFRRDRRMGRHVQNAGQPGRQHALPQSPDAGSGALHPDRRPYRL